MSTSVSGSNQAAVSKKADRPSFRVTINQLVGYNMAWYRNAAGLTQDQLGKRLGGWTKVAVSAAERSWDGRRVRQFSADEIVAIAEALGVPVIALLLPAADTGNTIEYTFTAGSGGVSAMDAAGLLKNVITSSFVEDDSPQMARFQERLMVLGISRLASPSMREIEEVLGGARTAADEILSKSRDAAIAITGEARARAEALERDAIERHRQAMGSLVMQREELERRVDDLRAFEREYRRNIETFLEEQLRDVRAGATP